MKARNVIITVLVIGGVGAAAFALMPRKPQLPEVTTSPVTESTFVKEVSAVGTVKATRNRALAFTNAGTVETVTVKVGDGVKKGQVLMTLDARALQTDLTSAKASLQAAQADLLKAEGSVQSDRLDSRKGVAQSNNALLSAQSALRVAKEQFKLHDQLYKIGSVSRTEWEQSRTTLQDAQIKVDNAQLDLESAKVREQSAQKLSASTLENARSTLQTARTRVQSLEKQLQDAVLKAPIDGVVSVLNVTAGGFAGAGTSVIEITDLTELYLEVPFNETRARELQPGQKATLEFDALPGQTVKGAVSRVDPTATRGQNSNSTINVNAQIAFQKSEVKPGFTASVKVETRRLQKAITVPLEAITEAENTYVYRIRPDASGEGLIEKVNVKILDRNLKEAAIEGLQPRDQVLTLNLDTVKAGERVRVAQP